MTFDVTAIKPIEEHGCTTKRENFGINELDMMIKKAKEA